MQTKNSIEAHKCDRNTDWNIEWRNCFGLTKIKHDDYFFVVVVLFSFNFTAKMLILV